MADYIGRLKNFLHCSESCYIVALLYIDRIVQKHSNLKVTRLNVHRLYLIAMVLAIKFNEDNYYTNEYYSSVGGISCEEVNQLESEMLQLLKYDLVIHQKKYDRYLQAVGNYYQTFMLPKSKIVSPKAKMSEDFDERSTQEESIESDLTVSS